MKIVNLIFVHCVVGVFELYFCGDIAAIFKAEGSSKADNTGGFPTVWLWHESTSSQPTPSSRKFCGSPRYAGLTSWQWRSSRWSGLVPMETTTSDTTTPWWQCVWPLCHLQSPWSGPSRWSLYRYGVKWYLRAQWMHSRNHAQLVEDSCWQVSRCPKF